MKVKYAEYDKCATNGNLRMYTLVYIIVNRKEINIDEDDAALTLQFYSQYYKEFFPFLLCNH